MILAIATEGVSEIVTSSDPHYAIWALACTTILALVGQILTYLKASRAEAGLAKIDIKVDGALSKFIESSDRLLEVTKGAEFQKGLKEGTGAALVQQKFVDAARAEGLATGKEEGQTEK